MDARWLREGRSPVAPCGRRRRDSSASLRPQPSSSIMPSPAFGMRGSGAGRHADHEVASGTGPPGRGGESGAQHPRDRHFCASSPLPAPSSTGLAIVLLTSPESSWLDLRPGGAALRAMNPAPGSRTSRLQRSDAWFHRSTIALDPGGPRGILNRIGPYEQQGAVSQYGCTCGTIWELSTVLTGGLPNRGGNLACG